MSSEAIPVVSALAALAELTANLVRAKDSVEVAHVLRRSVKWMLPIDHVSLVIAFGGSWVLLPTNTPYGPPNVVLQVLTTRSAAVVLEDAGVLVGDPTITAVMILPLVDGDDVGALMLGARDRAAFSDLDRGTCHLLALNVVAALRMVRLLERERAAREAAEHAIRMRDQMIQAVTHDLRNPLGVVMALFEMATEDTPAAMSADDVDSINVSLRRMKGLIEELLDTSKGQSGKLALRRTHADLTDVLREAVSNTRALVRGHALEIETPPHIVGIFDEPRMARVLGNLLSNAIKYSPSGGLVRVRATQVGRIAEVRVTDSGIGIPAADLPFVFERFRRAKNVGIIDGNGLGLASSREVMLAHGGSLDVESSEGQGSTFIVRLPLAG